MYEFEKTIERFCLEHQLIGPGMKVLAGVSGGADSVCLLLVLHKLSARMGFCVEVVHVEHGIRGSESLEDARFVCELAGRLGIPVTVRHVDVPGLCRKTHMTQEEAARELRYRAFEEEADKTGADRIAAAHNLDDQAETVLMNILRGSGLKGLEGMRPVRGRIIRPLLGTGRTQIEQYLHKAGQEWRTDRTNSCTDYTRNKIRLEIMPLLRRDINSRSAEHLVSLASSAMQAQTYLEGQAEQILDQISGREELPDGNEAIVLPVDFLRMQPAVLREYILRAAIGRSGGGQGLKDIGKVHISDLCELIGKGSGKRLDLPGRLKALRRGREMLLYHENT